jgi:hypothetical protein
MFIRTCHQSSWLQPDHFLRWRPKVHTARGKQGAILCVTSGLVRRLLLDKYPIRGCKDSKKLPTHRVVWLVPLQHLRQLRTLRTTWIVHVVRNLLRALDCKFVEPINELGIAANAWRPGVSSFLSRGRTADLSPRNPRASHFMRNQ